MPLEQEIQYFTAHKAELLRHHAGKYVLIKDNKFIRAFDTEEAAFAAGVGQFGVVPFLIKQILEKDPTENLPALTHGIIHACS